LPAQVLVTPLPPGFWGVVHHASQASGVLALVCLGDTPHRQECGGRGSHQPFLTIVPPLPCFVRGGALDPCWPTSSMALHVVPVAVGPRRRGLVCGPFRAHLPCRTSPQMRTCSGVSLVRTSRQSAPVRVGYVRVCGPLRPMTGRPSLCPSSSPRCPVPRPDGRATTSVGRLGLTQLSVQKRAARCGWRLYPGERLGCRHAQAHDVLRLTYHVGEGRSASLALSLSRGFTLTLPWRSP
jgi:hypothetical protein